jgi:NAD(P)-dependent dehydrogenase (short-subunit alcohol dehydrogenase family)
VRKRADTTVETAEAKLGRVSILVNNAGTPAAAAGGVAEEVWDGWWTRT